MSLNTSTTYFFLMDWAPLGKCIYFCCLVLFYFFFIAAISYHKFSVLNALVVINWNTVISWFLRGEVSGTSFTELKSGVGGAVFPFRGSRGESISLAFPASGGFSEFLDPYTPFSKASHMHLIDHFSTVTFSSDFLLFPSYTGRSLVII